MHFCIRFPIQFAHGGSRPLLISQRVCVCVCNDHDTLCWFSCPTAAPPDSPLHYFPFWPPRVCTFARALVFPLQRLIRNVCRVCFVLLQAISARLRNSLSPFTPEPKLALFLIVMRGCYAVSATKQKQAPPPKKKAKHETKTKTFSGFGGKRSGCPLTD